MNVAFQADSPDASPTTFGLPLVSNPPTPIGSRLATIHGQNRGDKPEIFGLQLTKAKHCHLILTTTSKNTPLSGFVSEIKCTLLKKHAGSTSLHTDGAILLVAVVPPPPPPPQKLMGVRAK